MDQDIREYFHEEKKIVRHVTLHEKFQKILVIYTIYIQYSHDILTLKHENKIANIIDLELVR